MNTETSRAGDLLVRIGGVVFLVGALATVGTMAPLFLGTEPFPAPAYFVCMLMGLGFGLAAAGLLTSIRAQRRTAHAEITPAGAPQQHPGGSAPPAGDPAGSAPTPSGRD